MTTNTIQSFKIGTNMLNFLLENNKRMKNMIYKIVLFEREKLINYPELCKKKLKIYVKNLYVLLNSSILLNKHIISGNLNLYHKLYYFVNLKFNKTLILLNKYNYDDIRSIYYDIKIWHSHILKLNKIYNIYILQNKNYIEFSCKFFCLNFKMNGFTYN
jgi:hypothetical protein